MVEPLFQSHQRATDCILMQLAIAVPVVYVSVAEQTDCFGTYLKFETIFRRLVELVDASCLHPLLGYEICKPDDCLKSGVRGKLEER